ncbi:MAG: hypothetical protein N2507_01435 [Candidatus Bipolaricaulota bacterium]|nr:hypothetical protein [Candidatus Bipolaricaulota bacterium]MCX7844019.1 hypothetical protein [Candidatus Bipolaricaulota bacterium]MDW8151995.1 hypothetical protein [Candidatus Bipolaricaulota bacterium]
MLRKARVFLWILVWMALPAWAQTAGIQVSATIANETCPAGFQLTQVIWLREDQAVGLQVLQVLIRQGQSYTVRQELAVMPTHVVVRGLSAGRPIEERVPMGQSVKFACGTITTSPAAVTPAQPAAPEVPLPPGMPKPPLSPGMSPAQLLSGLQAAGAQVVVQGTQDRPKLGDADDPILVGALPGGFAALGLWVSTTGGSLRASVTYDQPSAFVWLWVVPVPNFWNTAMAWSPWPGGGLAVALDRAQAYQPLTQWGHAPVPGTLFFVLLIKWDVAMTPFPFVMSLSN